jgi:hypothetical protein
MDEGPQVSVTGADALTGADTGTDAGEPGAGVVGDATASTPNDASSLPGDHADLTDLPDRPAEVGEVPDAASEAEAPPTDDAAPPAEAPPTGKAAPPAQPSAEPSRADDPAAADPQPLSELAGILTALGGRVDDLANAAAELSRLRSRDTDLIARLHEDVTRLRTGEIAIALNPVVTGMIKLHDQMVSLGALDDRASPAGMLRTQLLQIMELTCAVKPFTPAPGERFDASRHTGARRIPTTDPSADGTIASTIKVGFARADGSVVRVAEVEVHRLSG